MKLFRPEVFQGNFRKQNYFEGWYFKHVSADRKYVFSFIPGVSLSKTDRHAFIQVINGITGESYYTRYPLSDFHYSPKKLELWVGQSWFSETGIALNIHTPEISVKGKLEYSGLKKYPSTFLSPGIMGWYSFVPFMECKHGIASVLHELNGKIKVNGNPVDFSNGTGYIEKDWGTSFPESWIWLHCNTFTEPDCSFTFSVAKIPWLGSFFIGHICFLYLKGKFYLFTTYNKSKINKLTYSGKTLSLELSGKNYILLVNAEQNNNGLLQAPVKGKMNRIIKESIDSEIEFRLLDKHRKEIFSGTGSHAGLEVIEKILSYFQYPINQ